MAPTFKMPKKMNKLLNNELLVLGGGVLLVFLIINYSQSKTQVPKPAQQRKKAKNGALGHGSMNGNSHPSPPPPRVAPVENKPADLLPHDGNSEWAEFAPQGQGDLQGSGSLLHPQISQRPFNSVQGTNALRGDPQISIGEVPSIAAPSNPIHGNHAGLN
jgi:hypothetical protein